MEVKNLTFLERLPEMRLSEFDNELDRMMASIWAHIQTYYSIFSGG